MPTTFEALLFFFLRLNSEEKSVMAWPHSPSPTDLASLQKLIKHFHASSAQNMKTDSVNVIDDF